MRMMQNSPKQKHDLNCLQADSGIETDALNQAQDDPTAV
jgi:hypothetical protein